MDAKLSSWFIETLQLIALEDYSAQVFLIDIGDKRKEWQIGVDLLYSCVRVGLVRVIPYGDGMEQLSLNEYMAQMARSNPSAVGTDDWNSAKAWVGTYVIGTSSCIELLAAHGLLSAEIALTLSKGLRHEVASEPQAFPSLSFGTAEEALSHANLLERSARLSLMARSNDAVNEQESFSQFMLTVERLFAQHGVGLSSVPLFPITLR